MESSLPELAMKSLYRPLRSDNEFRLLILKQGYRGVDLQGSLHTICLSNSPLYNALSYTWDTECDSSKFITIDGVIFPISLNLWEFLITYRRPYGNRTVWIDAICINQLDDKEKGHQVRLMSQIYSRARLTIAWLGLGVPDAKSLFVLDSVSREPSANSLHEGQYDLSLLNDGRCQPKYAAFRLAILHICRKRYWTRVWILQELIRARQVVLQCGEQTLDWEKFCITLSYTDILSEIVREEIDYGHLYDIVRDRDSYRSYSWRDLEHTGRGLVELVGTYSATAGCKIARDRIFALIGLISRADDPLFHTVQKQDQHKQIPKILQLVDYTTAPEHLFTDVVTLYKPQYLLDFAMPLFRALELDIWQTADSDKVALPTIALRQLTTEGGRMKQRLYSFMDECRTTSFAVNKGSSLSLANLVLVVHDELKMVESVKFSFFTADHYPDIYLDVWDFLESDPFDIQSLLRDIMYSPVDCESLTIKLSIGAMVALCRIGKYLRMAILDTKHLDKIITDTLLENGYIRPGHDVEQE